MTGERSGAIGIDLGGTNLKLALLDGENRVIERLTVPTGGSEGHEAVIGRMTNGVAALRERIPELAIAGVGIGVPGMVDMASGVTGDLPNLPGRWSDVPVGALVARATGLPVGLINDGKAFAVAEHRLGAAVGAETALLVAVGTGIGGAVIAHGRVLFGVGGAAGEIGHLIVQPEGPRCTCGNLGCVETLASGPAIVGEAVRRIVQGFATDLTELSVEIGDVTPELVARSAALGDTVAGEVIDRAGMWLGIALAGSIALLAPEVVVIGGGVAPAGSRYFQAAEATARAHSGVTEIERIAFRPAQLGYEAGVVGAALWGRDVADAVAAGNSDPSPRESLTP
jgi:glucokinase